MEKEEKDINIEDIPKIFSINKKDDKYELKVGQSKPITLKIPMKLGKEPARICGMILDGSLSKDLSSCMFSQKKDLSKAREFSEIIKSLFGISPKTYDRNGACIVVFGNRTLAYFLHHCLGIHKSDENARIPKWIWDSEKEVMIEYLKYAFAMEGSVSNPRIRNKEIRFHSCDELHTRELKDFLKEKFGIKCYIQEYCVKDYGKKYYLSINSKEDIKKFAQIGIALESHERRIEEILELCKSPAWEITLVVLSNLNKDGVSIKEIGAEFPYLGCRRSIHERLSNLIRLGYISHKRNSYSLTSKGKKKAISLRDSVKIVPVRTKPKENEKIILEYIAVNKKAYRNQIAGSLGLPAKTVRDVLIRLAEKGIVRQAEKDKFGRIFWVLT